MNRPYIVNDEKGNPMNSKYPPDREKYGDKFGGYKSETEKLLFHDFVVMKKDLSFIFNGTKYYFYEHNTPAIAYNASSREAIAKYPSKMDLIEKFSIDNKPFIKLIDKISEIRTYNNVFKPHYSLDENGYPYNCKYPPNKEKHGNWYHGYKNPSIETLFYDFGVQNYDLYFKYKGQEYFVLNEFDHVALCDEHFSEEYEVFDNEMDFIENFKIDGTPLIVLIDELEYVEPE